jgi:two-component system, NtrC family, sensor kinase
LRIIDQLIDRFFKITLQNRLIVGFLMATFITGLVATVTSIWTINRSTIAEVQNRARQDINTAQLIYNNTLEKIMSQIQFTAEGSDLNAFIAGRDVSRLSPLKTLLREGTETKSQGYHILLDMLTLVDTGGNVLYRVGNPKMRGDNLIRDPFIRRCIERKAPLASTELMPLESILRENPDLSMRTRVRIVKTPRSAEIKEDALSEGMVMRAAYPIVGKDKKLLGILIGGVLLNRDNSIVDQITSTVYHGEKYKGRDMVVATIFQGGVRIATNVMADNNERAIGTILSKEVYDRVIKEGKEWVGRAFVVNDWYITTYTPIFNTEKILVGILYTGILEAKYRDIKWKLIWINLGITSLGMVIAFIISFRLGSTIITRIRLLKKATEAIVSGNLDVKLSPDKISGFDILDEAFNDMVKSLKEHNDQLQKMHQQLARSEKLTALGGMASGVAHEINNPLGGILLYSNLILEDIPEDSPARENVQKIIYQTNRCKEIVQGLLNFARTPTSEMLPLQINHVIKTSLNLVRGQSMFLGIEIETHFKEDLPEIMGDRSRLEEVCLNLFINAADAMDGHGKLTIATETGTDNIVRILVSDTGKGIEKEHLSHIFEPFFTTKEPGRGTGLGLSIAYGIIQKHNGSIDAESEPGKGTTFIISLPAYRPEENGSGQNAS